MDGIHVISGLFHFVLIIVILTLLQIGHAHILDIVFNATLTKIVGFIILSTMKIVIKDLDGVVKEGDYYYIMMTMYIIQLFQIYICLNFVDMVNLEEIKFYAQIQFIIVNAKYFFFILDENY